MILLSLNTQESPTSSYIFSLNTTLYQLSLTSTLNDTCDILSRLYKLSLTSDLDTFESIIESCKLISDRIYTERRNEIGGRHAEIPFKDAKLMEKSMEELMNKGGGLSVDYSRGGDKKRVEVGKQGNRMQGLKYSGANVERISMDSINGGSRMNEVKLSDVKRNGGMNLDNEATKMKVKQDIKDFDPFS